MKNKIISIIFIILLITSCRKSRDITGGGGGGKIAVKTEILDLQNIIMNHLKKTLKSQKIF